MAMVLLVGVVKVSGKWEYSRGMHGVTIPNFCFHTLLNVPWFHCQAQNNKSSNQREHGFRFHITWDKCDPPVAPTTGTPRET